MVLPTENGDAVSITETIDTAADNVLFSDLRPLDGYRGNWRRSDAVVGVDAVGAANFNPIPSEPYSSTDPPIRFSITMAHGTRSGAQVPQVTGPDGIDTSFFSPGVYLSTTVNSQFPTSKELDGDAFPNFFGTSAAAPNVAGVVALMKQANSKATPSDILDALEETAVPLNGQRGGTYNPNPGTDSFKRPAPLQSIRGPACDHADAADKRSRTRPAQ